MEKRRFSALWFRYHDRRMLSAFKFVSIILMLEVAYFSLRPISRACALNSAAESISRSQEQLFDLSREADSAGSIAYQQPVEYRTSSYQETTTSSPSDDDLNSFYARSSINSDFVETTTFLPENLDNLNVSHLQSGSKELELHNMAENSTVNTTVESKVTNDTANTLKLSTEGASTNKIKAFEQSSDTTSASTTTSTTPTTATTPTAPATDLGITLSPTAHTPLDQILYDHQALSMGAKLFKSSSSQRAPVSEQQYFGYRSPVPSHSSLHSGWHPSLADLLLIMRNLNLAHRTVESDSHKQILTDTIAPINSLMPSRLPTPIWLNHRSPMRRSPPMPPVTLPQRLDMTMSASSLNKAELPAPKLLTTSKPEIRPSGSDTVTTNKPEQKDSIIRVSSEEQKPAERRSPKISLLSPYSANFDVGSPSKSSVSERTSLANNLGIAGEQTPDRLKILSQKRKLYDRLKQIQETRAHQLANEIVSRRQPSQSYTINSDLFRHLQATPTLIGVKSSPESHKHNIENIKDDHKSLSNSDSRRDRDSSSSVKIQIGAKRPSKPSSPGDKKSNVSEMKVDPYKIRYERLRPHKTHPPNNYLTDGGRTPIEHAFGFDQDIELSPFGSATGALDYLDIYDEKPYISTLTKSPVHEDVKPLTVGDLASQHGYSVGLKSQATDYYPIIDNGITQSSNRYEEYAYAPYLQEQTLLSLSTLQNEIRKKQVLKAMEALAKGTDIAASLYNLYSPDHVTSSSNVHPQTGWSKYYADIINGAPEVDLSSQTYLPPGLGSPLSPLTNTLHLPSDYSYSNSAPVNVLSYPPVSSSKLNLSSLRPAMTTDANGRWALTKMPDLIPIPLAATVPGYLIRLPNGQILAAALTDSFSIQGIQRGPLSSSYKAFLNQRLKALIKNNQRPGQLNYNSNLMAADSGISPVTVVAPNSLYADQSSKGSDKGSGSGSLFSRVVLGQFRLKPGTQKTKHNQVDANKMTQNVKAKVLKVNPQPSIISPLVEPLATPLPIASLNEPVFSFADEGQLLDQTDMTRTSSATSQPLSTDSTDIFHDENTLALRARLNQLIGIRNRASSGLFKKTKKRQLPPPGGFEPPTFWLTAKRASRLRHGGICL